MPNDPDPTNGHNSDDMPELDEEQEFQFPQAEFPGNGGGGGQPGLKDLMVGSDSRGARRDPMDRMAVSSNKIEEYLPLTRITPQKLARHTRIIASLNNVNLGHSDPYHVLWFGWVGSIAINGQGRDEMVAMITADRHYQRQERLNRFRNMGDRARNPTTNLDMGE